MATTINTARSYSFFVTTGQLRSKIVFAWRYRNCVTGLHRVVTGSSQGLHRAVTNLSQGRHRPVTGPSQVSHQGGIIGDRSAPVGSRSGFLSAPVRAVPAAVRDLSRHARQPHISHRGVVRAGSGSLGHRHSRSRRYRNGARLLSGSQCLVHQGLKCYFLRLLGVSIGSIFSYRHSIMVMY